ncbi:MAG: hypothetical protein KIT09_26170 [Bryobacteraceae bacterium]|nr:hypothetical protein [Bryobacteraceae bacterium]
MFLLAANARLLAQTNSNLDRLRSLNGEILRYHGLARASGLTVQPVASVEATRLLDERFNALGALIEQDPRQALLMAFSPDLLAELAVAFPQSKSKLETHGVWQGPIRYGIVDGLKFAQSKTILLMPVDGKTVSLHLATDQPGAMKSGDLITVSGVRAGDRVAAEQASVTTKASWAQCATTGAQKIAVILVNLKNYALPAAMNANLVTGIVLGNSGGGAQNTPDWSVDDFWQQNSDGQTWVQRSGAGALKIVGPYTLAENYNLNGSCQYDALRQAAYRAADNDLDFQEYSRAIVVFPPNGACAWAGLGTVGCWGGWECPGDGACNYSWTMQRADQMLNRGWGVQLTTHELGHNLTLGHANTRDFGPEPLGPMGAAGTRTEYGDRFSTMGSWNFGFYNADHAITQLGWLLPGTQYLDVSSNGSYSLSWYGSRPAGLKALRIRRGAAQDNANLIVELRRNRGPYDSQLASQSWSGALIHYRDASTGINSDLVDFTATDTFGDPALAAGQTWKDPYSNVSLRVDSIVNDTVNLTVTYGASPCAPATPGVTISPLNPSVPAGTAVSYTVTVKNKDSLNCAAAAYDFRSTLPGAWSEGSFSPASLTIKPGGSATVKLTKTPPAAAAPGTYGINVAARHISSGLTASATASCTVTAAPPAMTVSVAAPLENYKLNVNVPITATVKKGSAAVAAATVQFALVRPNGQTVTKTLTTGTAGKATWTYKVTLKGAYSVKAVATKGTQKATSAADTFKVN